MASIQDALAKAQERAAQKNSKNRGKRPYDVVAESGKNASNDKLIESSGSDVEISASNVISEQTDSGSNQSEKLRDQPGSNEKLIANLTLSTSPIAKLEGNDAFVESQVNPLDHGATIELSDKQVIETPETVIASKSLNESNQNNEFTVTQDPVDVPDLSPRVNTTLDLESSSDQEMSFEKLLDQATEDAALNAYKGQGGEKGIDEYMKEKGWNKVPHSLQKWALKNFKGNDLKGIYYFFYLSIRNESPIISVGYSAIAEALGIDKKVAPKRIVTNLLKKGAILVTSEASYKTATKYKLIPMELLLQQDPEFFKKGKKVDTELTRDIDADVRILKSYLVKKYDEGEVFRVLPKYKFVLESYSANEVIEVIEHVSANGVFGIKPENIGNVHALISKAETFGKAFRSIKLIKGKSEKIAVLAQTNEELAQAREQEEEQFKFKAEQARLFIFASGEEEGKKKLLELVDIYRRENNLLVDHPSMENAALVHYYEKATR